MGLTGVSEHDEQRAQAAELFKSGKAKEAIELEKKVAEATPKEWLPHATLAYFMWYSGNPPGAVAEAKLAASLAPDIEGLQTNLGQMALAIGDAQTSIPAFENATQIAPDDPTPWLGIVRSLRSAGRNDDAKAALRDMVAQSNKSFEWFYQISEMCLQIDEPKIADEAAAKAMSLASTPEQNSKGTCQLFLAFLRDNQLDRARTLRDRVFNECHPDDMEIYLRCASLLLPVGDPAAGKKLLDCASANLKDRLSSSGFYRLGEIFERKAQGAGKDSTTFGAWNGSAEAAYRRAIALDPDRAVYYLALAGTLNQKGKVDEMAEALSRAQSLDKYDPLAPFLLAQLNKPQEHAAGQIVKQGPGDKPVTVNLTKVEFKINDLGCGCKLGKVRMALSKNKGVAFVSTSLQKPYRGTMLIDESMMSIDDVLAQAGKDLSPVNTAATSPSAAASSAATAASSAATAASQSAVTLELESRQPDIGVNDAIRIELLAKVGDFRGFPRKMQQAFVLVMPEALENTSDRKASL